METLARMQTCVQKINELAQFRPALSSVVGQVVQGIMATGSVVVSELLRLQVTKECLHAAEQRVTQALKNQEALEQLPEAYLSWVAPEAQALHFRSVDGSDLSKPASRHLEYLDVVRDGSAKPRERVVVTEDGVVPAKSVPWTSPPPCRGSRKRRRKPRARTQARKRACAEKKASRVKCPSAPAEKTLGYWMIAIEAGDGNGNHLPLFQDVFSTRDPAYQALGKDAWKKLYQEAIARVLVHVGRHGIWLFDRGFDDVDWINWTHAHLDQSIIRLRKIRCVRLGTPDAQPIALKELAKTLHAPYSTQVRFVDKSNHKTRYHLVAFNWVPIWIDGVHHPLYLIVVHTGKKNPMWLVTDRRPESTEEAGTLIQAYLERWGNEEITRACKQLTGLERVCVRSLRAIRRLVWLAMIAVGIQAFLILTQKRWTHSVLDRAKEFIRSVRFVLYRVFRVVKEEVRRAIEVRPRKLC